jgi:carbohydrate-binding DOMON domain-containing protein
MTAEFATLSTNVPGFSYEKEPNVAIVETTQDILQDVAEINKDVSEEDWVYPYPTNFVLSEHPIDDVRELKVRDTSMNERISHS